ncbi:MAG: hypothetical protein ACSHW1_16030 [Yoonia sp.]
MKPFLLALVALVVIAVASNQILVRLEDAGTIGSRASENARVD